MSGCAACVEGLCIVYQAANVVQPIDELPELLEGVLRCGHGFASGHLDCLLVDLAKPVHCPGYVVVFSVRPAGKPLLVLHEDDGVSMRQAATLPGGLRGRGSSSMLRLPVAVIGRLAPFPAATRRLIQALASVSAPRRRSSLVDRGLHHATATAH
eukprot:CAMPEP_0180422116 /NCGR_PEP_ID=MMETSP1036_2-20121128/3508_1 /TAXON_ID=632150 /ORGANISM="Azadinium spinosum, Strain 3D9" /LENGTH=154 /DNA_ID=CAMNT_0022427417 /DNA_START=109 /DNA_END=574 /DNA_ORIENTATION=+